MQLKGCLPQDQRVLKKCMQEGNHVMYHIDSIDTPRLASIFPRSSATCTMHHRNTNYLVTCREVEGEKLLAREFCSIPPFDRAICQNDHFAFRHSTNSCLQKMLKKNTPSKS